MDDKWFKQQQKKVGVTAEDIANRMGRSRSAVSHIYTGQRRMSLDWAKAFAEVLQVPLSEVLDRAGVLEPEVADQIAPGFAESDAVFFRGSDAEVRQIKSTAQTLGGDAPGIDTWTVKSDALIFDGYLPGDFIIVDTLQSERCKAGDIVIAQIYDRNGGAKTVLRRYQPPVLISATHAAGDRSVHFVDGNNVAIRGKVIASWRAA